MTMHNQNNSVLTWGKMFSAPLASSMAVCFLSSSCLLQLSTASTDNTSVVWTHKSGREGKGGSRSTEIECVVSLV